MARNRLLALLLFSILSAVCLPALAVEPNEVLADPALEARARDLGQNLRCVVCQNQSIDDSNADLARDLRLILRERLKAGDTDAAAIGYVVARYGNFVLLEPPLQVDTLLLWFGPGIILVLALSAFWMLMRSPARRGASGPDPLTAAELEELQAILSKRLSQ